MVKDYESGALRLLFIKKIDLKYPEAKSVGFV